MRSKSRTGKGIPNTQPGENLSVYSLTVQREFFLWQLCLSHYQYLFFCSWRPNLATTSPVASNCKWSCWTKDCVSPALGNGNFSFYLNKPPCLTILSLCHSTLVNRMWQVQHFKDMCFCATCIQHVILCRAWEERRDECSEQRAVQIRGWVALWGMGRGAALLLHDVGKKTQRPF